MVGLFIILYYAKRQQSSTNIRNKKHKMHKHTQKSTKHTSKLFVNAANSSLWDVVERTAYI